MSEPGEKPSLQRQMVKGSAWGIGVRWALRMLGLVSTIFLARLLTPADFGIVTIAMIILGTVEIFTQTGQHLAIIRHPNPTREHYDSAWTIFIILYSALALIIFFCAPLTVIYFHEPRAMWVVRVLAFRTFINGFENVGIVDFQKHMQFQKGFLYRTLPSVVSFFVTLAAAFILRNYWALVIGILSQEFSSFVFSYVLSPFRPRLDLSKARELWSFSIWTFVRGIGVYLGNQMDRAVIGGFAGAAAMGRYEVAVDVASSPTQEINNPMMTVLFPVMATAQQDRQKMRDLYLTVLYWSALICSSTAVGVTLVTSDLVDVVLGAKWVEVKPLMPWLALAYGIGGTCYSIIPVFDTLNKPHISARIQWTNLIVGVIALVCVGIIFHDLLAIAILRFVCAILFTPANFTVLALEMNFRPRDFVAVFWRPVLASLVMAASVLGVESVMQGGLIRLAASTAVGAVSYCGAIMVLWWMIGRPDGPEKAVWHMLRFADRRRSSLTAELESGSGVIHSAAPESPSQTDG